VYEDYLDKDLTGKRSTMSMRPAITFTVTGTPCYMGYITDAPAYNPLVYAEQAIASWGCQTI